MNYSVLIVDDDSVACDHAKLILGNAGIATETALSGQEAVEKVKLRQARREPYNLIVIDWKMPEMDGVETTKAIRSEIGDETAIIILTAYNWDDILDEALEAGYYDAILMDMRMPEMNGMEATAAIRGLDRPDAKEIPIIALTANAFDEDVQRSLQAGMNAHLSKPVEPEVLFETLEELL